MSVEEQTQTLKRGRPKKIKTQEEIDVEKQKKREEGGRNQLEIQVNFTV